MSSPSKPRLIVGVTGASGAVYGLTALRLCRELGVETHLVVSRAGVMALKEETGLTLDGVHVQADFAYKVGDVGAAIASGTFRSLGMLIAPCSVRTFSEIATGVTTSLLTRAADVVLKEKRRLVLMVRESPLHLGHLRSLAQLAEMGAVIAPPVPAFYTQPQSLEDLVAQSVGRALDLFDLDWAGTRRWRGMTSDS